MSNKVETIPAEQRTISAELMKSVADFLPNDPFRLTPEILGKEFTVTGFTKTNFGNAESFLIDLANDDMRTSLSASALKACRVLGKADIKITDDKFYNQNKNVIVRSKAEEIWSNSRYFHSERKMSKDAEFVLPSKLRIEYAVVKEDATTGKVKINNFLYKGFRKVVEFYGKSKTFPTWEDFTNELKKGGTDRIAGLPVMVEPTLIEGVVAGELNTITYNLILSDIKD